jgi:hypothetical protein
MFKKHPIIWTIIGILFISGPQWLSGTWGLFCSQPFFQWIHAKGLTMINPLMFSWNWITLPIGIGFLAFILWEVKKPNEKTKKEKQRELLEEIGRKYCPEKYLKIVTVDSAIWRASEGVLFDVTQIVKGHITGGKLELRCTVDVLGEPHANLGKTLTVEYWYDGEGFTRIFREGEVARLP